MLNEEQLENVTLEWLAEIGYTCLHDREINPESGHPERQTYGDVILLNRFKQALQTINPSIPPNSIDDAIKPFLITEFPSLIEENRRLHQLMVNGIPVEYLGDDGTIQHDTVWPIDFETMTNNDFLAVQQFTVIEDSNRRPDVVLFINGLPLGVIELKNPSLEDTNIDKAFNQLQTYKHQISSLFRTNAALVISDGMNARIGSLTANSERFMPWRTLDGITEAPKSAIELEILVKGAFDPTRFLTLLKDYTVFWDMGDELIKIVAGYHQLHAVQHAVEQTITATSPQGDGRIGVIWHTQGSGKSLLMAFYAGQIMQHPAMKNPTLVIITDRNDLDDQLYKTFDRSKALIRETPKQAKNRDDLFELLNNRQSGGVIFTTVQKFTPEKGENEYPLLTERSNVIVIADEAHRSQYGFKATFNKEGSISYGFAKYLRDALPNAAFIGFTGTPIETADVNTKAVFGDYIDVYDISQAVKDNATVPIFYESRVIHMNLDESLKEELDQFGEDIGESESAKFKLVEKLVGSEDRLTSLSEDLVTHFEDRVVALKGKAMIVCMSRRIAVELYHKITALRPTWHSDDDKEGEIKVVMTGSASDPESFQPHICNKTRKDTLAKRMKDPNDTLKLVIVCDMWLTGFDAPCMHTMYLDKPLKGHNLMQSIARVNRVFQDKPAGLVVDYIGIAQNLKHALTQYSPDDQQQTGVDEAEAERLLREKHAIVQSMFHGLDYKPALGGSDRQRLMMMAEAMNFIQEQLHQEASKEDDEHKKKKVMFRYHKAVAELSKAFALAGTCEFAKQIREEVGFFQAVRAALAKTEQQSADSSPVDLQLAIQQIVSRSVISTDIIDILEATGIQSPDISILSDEFLEEVRGLEKKNLAIEALKKLLNDEVRVQMKSNVVQSRQFSERLKDAITRYHNNTITSLQVIQELIEMAKDIRAAKQRGEEDGLTTEEIAFYDALANNETAVEVMGVDELKVIAHELVETIKANLSVDWARRDSARAKLRLLVKKVLKKRGYPPDLQDEAIQTVLQQAEQSCKSWV